MAATFVYTEAEERTFRRQCGWCLLGALAFAAILVPALLWAVS